MGDEASTRAALDPSRAILRLTYPDGSVRVFDEDAERAFGRMDWSRAEWINPAARGATTDPAGFPTRFPYPSLHPDLGGASSPTADAHRPIADAARAYVDARSEARSPTRIERTYGELWRLVTAEWRGRR